MIVAKYDRKHLTLTVKGHAQSAEAGKDLICAAASILVYTLAGNVAQLSADKKQVRRPVVKIKEGNSEISCDPVHGMRSIVTVIFDSICSGFDVLQQRYPDFVSYSVEG